MQSGELNFTRFRHFPTAVKSSLIDCLASIQGVPFARPQLDAPMDGLIHEKAATPATGGKIYGRAASPGRDWTCSGARKLEITRLAANYPTFIPKVCSADAGEGY